MKKQKQERGLHGIQHQKGGHLTTKLKRKLQHKYREKYREKAYVYLYKVS